MTRERMEETNNRFIEALRRGNAEGCAAAYSDDPIVLPPHSPMFRGKQGAKEFWQGAINIGVRDGTLKTLELEEIGDTAIEIGAFTLDIHPEGGEPTKDVGKYLVVWKRQADGSWKWYWDIFSSDLPVG